MQLIRTFRANEEHKYYEDSHGKLYVAGNSGETPIEAIDLDREMAYQPRSVPSCFVVPLQDDTKEKARTMIVHFYEARWLLGRGMKVNHAALSAFNAFKDTL